MSIRSQQDFWAGIIFLVAGAAFVWGSERYDMGTVEQMGPGYFPRILGGLTVVIGFLTTSKSLVLGPPGRARIGAFAWRPLFFIVAANLAIGVMLGGLPSIGMPALGLVLGTYALVFVAALAGNEFRFGRVAWHGGGIAEHALVFPPLQPAAFFHQLALDDGQHAAKALQRDGGESQKQLPAVVRA